ncbi:MAG: alpha-L-fucosidase [Puniceicoccales bacterium]|jgi:alpha-L-fucosidase|nr:alpha-L-fucosidase [Puniceicoccales bacterium]
MRSTHLCRAALLTSAALALLAPAAVSAKDISPPLAATTAALAPPAAPTYNSPEYPAFITHRARELQSLRWGMFICWSFSTFSGKEWTPGIKSIDLFRATSVDTDQWARTAKEAGMGYILFLTKHHDGFCLWDTATTERKVTRAPLGRDVLAELRKSCDKYGIKLALYFSEGEWDWPKPSPKTPHAQLPDGEYPGAGGGFNAEMKKAQLKELLTRYGPIEYIWFDHAIGNGGLSHADTTAWCKQFQPGCFIGYNHGKQATADIRLGEMGKPGPLTDDSAAGPHFRHGRDVAIRPRFLLAEFTYPILPPHKGGAMWFYSLPLHDSKALAPLALYKDYLGAVKYGNIFSIDVGPNYDGKLRDIDVQTLREVGRMIREKSVLPAPISKGKKSTASSTWELQSGLGAAAANDGNEATRWGAASDARSGWLEIDLGKPANISKVVIVETAFPRIRQFCIEYLDPADSAWKVAAAGEKVNRRELHFNAPIRAARWRLNILQATDVPTVNEFQLFE